MDWCKFLVFDIQMKRMNMYHLFQNTTKLRIGYDDPPNQEIFNCMQYEIPELSETGYVLIKSPNEIEIFKTEDSPSETLTQRDTTAKQYRQRNNDQLSFFRRYVWPTIQHIGAASGAVGEIGEIFVAV